MKKYFIFIIFLGFFFYSSCDINASILTVDKSGEITWKVLSEADSRTLDVPKKSTLEVKEVVEEIPTPDSQISFRRTNEKISMVVTANGSSKELDVTNWKDDIIEIEERPEIQKVTIGLANGKFSLEQNGTKAYTIYPITIDPKTGKLSLMTDSGDRFISLLPFQAVESLLRSRVVNKVEIDKLEIVEEGSELQYSILGEKILNFYDIYKYSIPIKAKVSAASGEVLLAEAPNWYKVFGSLFSYLD